MSLPFPGRWCMSLGSPAGEPDRGEGREDSHAVRLIGVADPCEEVGVVLRHRCLSFPFGVVNRLAVAGRRLTCDVLECEFAFLLAHGGALEARREVVCHGRRWHL